MTTMDRCISLYPHSSMKRKIYRRHSKNYRTYLGMIAYIIQDSPNKMLTFSQLMKQLGACASGDRKSLENTIRVCLSSNDCFVKVPVSPDYPHAKRNYWRVDESRITAKMWRRHFSGMLHMFPGLSSVQDVQCEGGCKEISYSSDPPTSKCSLIGNNKTVKFSSPFSIESLLKDDGCNHRSHSPDVGQGVFKAQVEGSQTLLHDERAVKQHFYAGSDCRDYLSAYVSEKLSKTRFFSDESHGRASPAQFTYEHSVLFNNFFNTTFAAC